MSQFIWAINSITQNFGITAFVVGVMLGAVLLPFTCHCEKEKRVGKEIEGFAQEIMQKDIPSQDKEIELFHLYKTHHYSVFRIHLIMIVSLAVYSFFAVLFMSPLRYFSLGEVNTTIGIWNIAKTNFLWGIPVLLTSIFMLKGVLQKLPNICPFKMSSFLIDNGACLLSLFLVMSFASTSYFIFQLGFTLFETAYFGFVFLSHKFSGKYEKIFKILKQH